MSKFDLFQNEIFYDLKLGFCESCKLTQTLERPSKEAMFNDNYAYFTSVNQPMVKHFNEAAATLRKDLKIDENSFVVEIGSNDGAFLHNFTDIEHLGIEPSINVVDEAMKRGIDCWGTFFNKETAFEIINKKRGTGADLIYAANVFGHTENIKEILEGIKLLLAVDGTFVFEIYYLPKLIEQRSFDLIYDEHIFYYSLNSLQNLFWKFGLQLYDVEELSVHGGSIRGYVRNGTGWKDQTNREPTSTMQRMLENEFKAGYKNINPLLDFSSKVQAIRTDLLNLVNEIKNQGKTIAGYGATAKSTTVLNYCGIDSTSIDFVVDSTPFKQGKYTPGTHIPIVPEQTFRSNPPDYTILFAWNYAEAIMAKQKWYGGKWVLLHPSVKVI